MTCVKSLTLFGGEKPCDEDGCTVRSSRTRGGVRIDNYQLGKGCLKPCVGVNVNICVAEGCYDEGCIELERSIRDG